MNPQLVWEIIGYVGSALVLVSLLMSSVIKLRIINTIGSLVFCIYAIAIQSYPTAVMNGALVLINIYFLIKISRSKKSFSIVEAAVTDSSVRHFLSECSSDIEKYFPGYVIPADKETKTFLIYQGMTVSGIFSGVKDGTHLEVILDYSTPQYRDCSVGRFVYEKLKSLDFTTLTYTGNNDVHKAYVQKMGFVKENGCFVKHL